jgi:hypothetical protein
MRRERNEFDLASGRTRCPSCAYASLCQKAAPGFARCILGRTLRRAEAAPFAAYHAGASSDATLNLKPACFAASPNGHRRVNDDPVVARRHCDGVFPVWLRPTERSPKEGTCQQDARSDACAEGSHQLPVPRAALLLSWAHRGTTSTIGSWRHPCPGFLSS